MCAYNIVCLLKRLETKFVKTKDLRTNYLHI